jgi:hypothetical protein
VIPATLVAAAIVLISRPGRSARMANLVLVAGSVALALPWTLHVYSAGSVSTRSLAPGAGLLRQAAVATLLSALAAGTARAAIAGWAARFSGERSATVRRRARRALMIAAVPALVVGVVAAAPWVGREYRAFTALRVNQSAPTRFFDASGFRYDLWRVALDEFAAHPVVGLGAGNYDVEYYRLRRNPEYVIQPHSLELQIAAELGVGGLISLLLFCGAILWAGAAGRRTLAAEDRFVRIAAAGTFVAWLTATSVDWLYDIPGLTGMAVVAGALLVVSAGDGSRRRSGPRRRVAVVAGLAIVAALAASVGRQYVASRYEHAGASEVSSSPRAAIPTLLQASRLDPFSLTTRYALAAAYAREGDYLRARAPLLSAAAREPHNYVPLALLGDLALRHGNDHVAALEYRRASALDPNDPAVRAAARAASAGER